MMRTLILWLICLPAAAQAQQVFKCVAGIEVSYQSTPCVDGHVVERTWDYGQYQPPDRTGQDRTRSEQRSSERRSRGHGGRSRVVSVIRSGATADPSHIGRCARAKARRDRELYKLGPRKPIEALRSWDSYIAESCRF